MQSMDLIQLRMLQLKLPIFLVKMVFAQGQDKVKTKYYLNSRFEGYFFPC
jgi:hypothetical protein